MKRSIQFSVVSVILVLIALPVMGHHPAEGIVDDEVYAMIDEMVADTPHALLDFDDMDDDNDMTNETTIETPSLMSLERMIDDGLLNYAAMLDGDVTIAIDLTDGRIVVLTVTQTDQ